jgi:hypothetical protein
MTFAKEMMGAKAQLEEMGHEVKVPCDIETHLQDASFIDNLEADIRHAVENNVLKTCFGYVADSDAVLFLNYPKNDIPGYVGTSSMMEMGIAFHYGKKIYLLHEPPHFDDARWAVEVNLVGPTVINGDLTKIHS